jgi:hypothetical protein
MTQPDSPAAELRTAAKLLRERASAATPGPWHVHEANGFLRVDNARDKTREAWTGKSGADLAEENRDTAEWIALMHPGVGEPLADWLERQAATWSTSVPVHDTCTPATCAATAALAVARALLGTAR